MTQEIKNICCIGAGYVGGPTMAVIASKCPNIQVNVIDINSDRINAWNSTNLENLPIYEPGLSDLIKKCRGINLHFSTDMKNNISKADMIFISVNTPTKTKGKGAGQAIDLKWVESSARTISLYAKGRTIVVEKSTLPVRTAETIKNILASSINTSKNNEDKTFFVLSNPEFLSEGKAIDDLNNPDRVLIGGDNDYAINSLIKIYSNWVNKSKILTTDLWSSELSKLTANAFLAQRISSINSISALCEATGADINHVALAVGSDKRLGKYFLNSGPGFGGSCFKKDILNLVYICNHYGLTEVANYWQTVIDINQWQQKRISDIIVQKLFGTVSGKKIAILGFAFKANTNDTRESPSINICKDLIEEGATLHIYDPKVEYEKIKKDLDSFEISSRKFNDKVGGWILSENIFDAAKETDAIIVLTEWDRFKEIDWAYISSVMRKPSWLFDTRSICDIKGAKLSGLNVWSVGNGK